ncbi:MAG: FecR family protein [Mucilaginibacter sp.]
MQSEERTWILISRAVSGEISPAEQEELEMLFIQHPELRTHFESIENIRLSPNNSTIDERRALERGLAKFEQSLREDSSFADLSLFNSSRLEPLPRKSNKKWLVAASIVGLLVISTLAGYYLKSTKPLAIQQEVATHYGKRINTTLPDGSKVWLNSGSNIKYAAAFGANGKREVELNGEAFFDVVHDSKHPFIVHAGKFNVVVLGTAFNVKAYATDSTMETTLIRGKVVVLNQTKPGSRIVLLPNEKLTVKTNNIVKNTLVKTKDQEAQKDTASFAYSKTAIKENVVDGSVDETSWVSNKLVFKKERFNELAEHLDRWYNVEIVFDNDKYTKEEFTGAFKDQNIDEVMRALQLSGSFHYTMTNNKIHIY